MTLSPRHLFLIDGVGAIITAAILAGVLAQFETTFGMPSRVLYVLAGIAGTFAVFSLTCYFKALGKRVRLLGIIAVANLAYCLLTLSLIVAYRNEITLLGVAYFAGEIFVVGSLAMYEIVTVRRAADR